MLETTTAAKISPQYKYYSVFDKHGIIWSLNIFDLKYQKTKLFAHQSGIRCDEKTLSEKATPLGPSGDIYWMTRVFEGGSNQSKVASQQIGTQPKSCSGRPIYGECG